MIKTFAFMIKFLSTPLGRWVVMVLVFFGCMAVVTKEDHFGLDEDQTYMAALLAFAAFIYSLLAVKKKVDG